MFWPQTAHLDRKLPSDEHAKWPIIILSFYIMFKPYWHAQICQYEHWCQMKNLMEEVKLNDELQWLFFLSYQFHPSVAWPQWKCPFTSAYKLQFPLKWWDRSGWYSSMWDQTKSDHFVQIDLFLVNWWRSVSPWLANFHCSQPIRLELAVSPVLAICLCDPSSSV